MFSTLLRVILVSLTSCSVFAIENCSEIYKVEKYHDQISEILTPKKVVCFKAESGRVRLKLMYMCNWFPHTTIGKYNHWQNYYDFLDVYDGCNTTENKVKKRIRCSKCCKYFEICNKEIRWTSKETSCLKVIARRSLKDKTFKDMVIVDADDDDHGDGDDLGRRYPCRETCPCPRPYPPPPPDPDPQPAPRPAPRPPRKRIEEELLVENEGIIKSLHYPQPYPTFMEYTYVIELPKTERIQLTFSDVDLPKKENGFCKKDYIEIYDGTASWAKKTIICGNDSYPPIISKSYEMKIKFIADKENGKNRGFKALYGPYQPTTRPNVTQKVTGVVIGTACGLVFIVLTFLAICHSRRIAWLRRQYDAQSIDSTDAIEERAPPNYDIVMSSPEKYPLTEHSSKRTEYHFTGIPQNEAPPSYPDLFPNAEPGHEVQSSDVSRNVDGDQFTMEANDVNESEDRDVREIDSGNVVGETSGKENDVSKNDAKAVDVRSENKVRKEREARKGSDVRRGSDARGESDARRGSDAREESDIKPEDVGEDVKQESAMGEYNVDVVNDGPDTVAYQEYSRAITTDV